MTTSAGPPVSRRTDVADVVHGSRVADPYRWLEDGTDPEVVDWVAAQHGWTRHVLDHGTARDAWRTRLEALVGLATVSSCALRGDRLFCLERAAHADQFALVVRAADDPLAEAKIVLDPTGLAADAAVAIDWYHPSPDGTLVAVGLSDGGSERSVLHVLDTATATVLPVRIPETRAASVAWEPDGSGFFYACYPPGDEYHRHIRHRSLRSDRASDAEDPVVFDRLPTPQSWPDVSISPDGRYVLVEMMVGWGRRDLHLLDRTAESWREVVAGVEATTSLSFAGDVLVGVTTVDAPHGRGVVVRLDDPAVASWQTVIPERPGVVLGGVVAVDAPDVPGGAGLLAVASHAAVDTLERWSWAGERLRDVELPAPVSIAQVVADPQAAPGSAFALVSSFTEPTAVWRVGGGPVQRWTPSTDAPHDVPDLVVDRHTCTSLDGTEIGLFVIRRRDVEPQPDTPTLLNGYGGFAISESPGWMPNAVAWCAAGGQWVVAGLRGGYEHGEPWHQAGRRAAKQNVFDDFHAAAAWLVAEGMTSTARLGLVGGSNGGLLVGAALTQQPDLARAVWCAVPLLDMVRFPQFLIARLWTDEYGDPAVAEEFAWLYAYSPYHRVRDDIAYPAVLFTTAESDTRVDPLHARKMAAALQMVPTADPRERPVLLWQAGRAGHGAGKPASMRIDEGADALTFLSMQLGGPQ